jgi:hypothetical protein
LWFTKALLLKWCADRHRTITEKGLELTLGHYQQAFPQIRGKAEVLETVAKRRTRTGDSSYLVYYTPLRSCFYLVNTLDTDFGAYYNRRGMLLGPLRWRTA